MTKSVRQITGAAGQPMARYLFKLVSASLKISQNDEVSVVNGVSQLDLDRSMAKQFVPIVVSFGQEQGGDQAKELLEKGLRPIA